MADALTRRSILMTGFPGFLSEHLLGRLAETTDSDVHLLCLSGTAERARRQLEILESEHPDFAGRWTIHTGDLTAEQLGLDPETYEELTGEVGVVWHLAAIYDLAVDEEIAYRVNVGGTAELLDFCEACDDFAQLNYVSTCYVAGERTGVVREDELDLGQHHKNHYEATKFWAEVEVQRRWDEIPTAIFRPAIVVGDSHTGQTAKYDGPYFVFQLLDRLPEWMPVPAVGTGNATVNLVPIDFVADALAELGHRPDTDGRVYQIADPQPMTARQIVDRVLELMGRRKTMGQLPATWVDRALANDTVEQWTGVPREALTYFNHDVRFDTTNTVEALRDTAIDCPPLSTYLDRLVDFFLQHPEQPPAA